jgi:hypothetical protein
MADAPFIQGKLADERIYVQMSLDRSQAGNATRAILDLNHDFMLKQMLGTKLDVAAFLAPKTNQASSPVPRARRWPGQPVGHVSRLGLFEGVTADHREQFRR